jgi:demethylsterigmatocystin 6-O-methyltransferase
VILKHQIEAMAEDSIILIDDMVLPNEGVPWQVSQIDVTMMWNSLYGSVGLKILKQVVYTPGVHETVTALVRK